MNFKWLFPFLLMLVCFTLGGLESSCQTIRGSVYDMSKTRPLEGVSVMSTSGKFTTTNMLGNYSIDVTEKDSIYFSYLNKPTIKFAVSSIANPSGFDISLHVPTTILPEVRVMPPNYKFDSTQNREEYAKIFNFRKPGLGITSAPPGSGGAGVGLDLDELINVFRFKRTRSMLSFQRRLVQEEEDKYVDHRFNKILVRKITGLGGEQLDKFMRVFRPSYEFTLASNDYEFYYYIKQSYLQYRAVFN